MQDTQASAESAAPAEAIDWAQLLDVVQTQGLDLALSFGKNLAIAIAIFYFGKLVVSLIVRGMRKVMKARSVDKTLEVFLCNMVRIGLMAFVIIAAIGIPLFARKGPIEPPKQELPEEKKRESLEE